MEIQVCRGVTLSAGEQYYLIIVSISMIQESSWVGRSPSWWLCAPPTVTSGQT